MTKSDLVLRGLDARRRMNDRSLIVLLASITTLLGGNPRGRTLVIPPEARYGYGIRSDPRCLHDTPLG